MCGDQVTFRLHHPKTAPKRIELQGKKGWYISKEAGATVKVMEKKEEEENEFLFHLVYKIDVLQARKRVLFEWGFKGREAASEETRKVQEGGKEHNQQKQMKTMEGRQENPYLQMERGGLYLSQMKYLQEVDTDRILEMAEGSKAAVDKHAMREVEMEEIDPSIQDEVGAANGILRGMPVLWRPSGFFGYCPSSSHHGS
uniref:Uncharacterized protein n=1 Tax=Chromera velia CCMP2878 TaxID=1169474 RepID=A0A0G4F3D1_9ALVE|eukprot:Cvel_14757.t1-p1 / transcript=Cvel_14757.t1 / gene=Cvel_14757 / organism=Chromera_velia_CCMP2878 / gene_product=hypothetical protein / transcript_product=hypothetical protein / location=Cvel_scaffold1062:3017-22425(-) / protein_length=198 / sequence_SO=supercontig / SO=protein_coding / is_pseudo=false